jgi:Tol biopolymer transport system component/DNA-binding winged helix-turn-helix (wHTH) protein
LKEPIPKRTKHFYSFGPFRLYVAERELFRGTEPVALAPKAIDTLMVLLSRRGHVVEKDELMKELWPDTFVEEASLVQQISNLRKALGDRPDGRPYIETIARRGYRFAAPVTDSWEEEPAETRLAVAGSADEEARPAGRRRWLPWLAAAAIVLAVGVAIVGFFIRPKTTELRPVPLNSLLGLETNPAISPDGRMVAFSWTGEGEGRRVAGGPTDIYVQQVGGETPVRRTDTPEREISPAWSPDSSQIAFCRKRQGEPGFTIHVKEAVGGPEQQLGESYRGCGLAWSPDGQFLAVAGAESGKEPRSLYLLSIETREKRKLTTPPSGFAGDGAPAFSPDGCTLAFVRSHNLLADDVYLLSLRSNGVPEGEPQRLTPKSQFLLDGLDWTADGRGIVFAAGGDLWRISVPRGNPERLNVGGRGGHPSVSREGDRLVYVTRDMDADLWRVRGPNATPAKSPAKPSSPEQLFSSTAWDTWPKYSPDGKRIVFGSGRRKPWRIWRCDSDGSDCLPLTSVPGLWPRWSPDGRSIAFTATAEEDSGNIDIFVVSAEGGEPHRVTSHDAEDMYASWSTDGKWIHFGSNRSGNWQIWKIPSQGGDAVRVTRNGGMDGYESADGRFLYYAKRSPRGIWRIPVEGGEETKVLDHGMETLWELLEDGICFLAKATEAGRAIKFFRFSTGRLQTVREFPKGTVIHGLAVSPDGRWVLCSLVERWERDIMLVENFR